MIDQTQPSHIEDTDLDAAAGGHHFELMNVVVSSDGVSGVFTDDQKSLKINAKDGSDIPAEGVKLGYTEVEWTY